MNNIMIVMCKKCERYVERLCKHTKLCPSCWSEIQQETHRKRTIKIRRRLNNLLISVKELNKR